MQAERPKSAAKRASYPGKQNKSLKAETKEVKERIETLPNLPSKSAVETGEKRVSLNQAIFPQKESEEEEE